MARKNQVVIGFERCVKCSFNWPSEMNVQTDTDWKWLYGKHRMRERTFDWSEVLQLFPIQPSNDVYKTTLLHLLNVFFIRFINWSLFESLTQEYDWFLHLLHSPIPAPVWLPFRWVNNKKKLDRWREKKNSKWFAFVFILTYSIIKWQEQNVHA